MGRFVETQYIADRRLYLDENGGIVEADSPDKVSLFAIPGQRMSMADAMAKGLVKEQEQAASKSEPDGVDIEEGLRDELIALKEQLEEAQKGCKEANEVAGSESEKRAKLLAENKALYETGHKMQAEMQALTAERDKAEKEAETLKARVKELEAQLKDAKAKAIPAPPADKAINPAQVENK